MHWDWTIDGWIIVVGILSTCSCALIGNYLVLRRLSLMGDAISHAVLPGLAMAFILSGSRAAWPMFVGAVIVGAMTALLTQVITRYGKVEHGAAMGVVFSILFALGLILIRQAADRVDLDPGCVLYGNIVQIPLEAIGEPDSAILAAFGIHQPIPPAAVKLGMVLLANMLFIAIFYKELKIAAFDPDLATTVGINASVMHYALMIMVAVTTVANFESVGSILVIAMLIVPATAAHLLTDRLGVMILLSVVLATASAVLGHLFAMYGPGWVGLNMTVNTSAMMAVVAGGLLVATILFSPHHGLIARAYRRTALAARIVRQDILGLLYRWRELEHGARPMLRREVLDAVGDVGTVRRSLRALVRRREVELAAVDGGEFGLELTERGMHEASRLVRSHRLWESYLAKHFRLADDHLHAPAERMEHYINEEMDAELREQLIHPSHDPHGKPIPSDEET